MTENAVGERRAQLGLLPEDLAGRVHGLQSYEFASTQAREHFEQLLERLREEVVQSYLDQLAGAAAATGPEQREHIRDALDALNRMMEQRSEGEPLDPSFEEFMGKYGDLFPGDPKDLDELLEQLAQRMAAASAMLASMSPGQRAQLQSLMDELLGDMDLSWQVNRLAGNLRAAFPGEQWDRRMSFSGGEGLGMSETTDMFQRLGELDQLEQMLSGAPQPGALAEIDLDRVRDLVGKDASASLAELQKLARRLEEAGLVEQREGRLELTPKGLRRDRPAGAGGPVQAPLQGSPRRARSRPDGRGPRACRCHQALRARRPVQPAHRTDDAQCAEAAGGRGRAGSARACSSRFGSSPEDFEIERTEYQTQCATALARGPVPVDADAGQFPRGEEGRTRDAGSHLRPIPEGLPGDHRLLRAGAGDPSGGAAGRLVGLRLRDEHAARAVVGTAPARARTTGPARSS